MLLFDKSTTVEFAAEYESKITAGGLPEAPSLTRTVVKLRAILWFLTRTALRAHAALYDWESGLVLGSIKGLIGVTSSNKMIPLIGTLYDFPSPLLGFGIQRY